MQRGLQLVICLKKWLLIYVKRMKGRHVINRGKLRNILRGKTDLNSEAGGIEIMTKPQNSFPVIVLYLYFRYGLVRCRRL